MNISKSWSAKDRSDYVKELSETTYDVLIVGGGITGAGVLRALGLRNIKAALIDKEDFAFGTSSKSTRLAHGGMRYIFNKEYRLVSEACHERDWLRGAFPNLVRPTPVMFINFSLEVAKIMGRAFRLYDLLSGFGNYKNYRHIPLEGLNKHEPKIKIPNVHSGCLIYECVINDARLTTDVIKEGVSLGGVALNYVEAKGVVKKDGKVTGISALDKESGDSFVISARNVVNACGPWTDDLMTGGKKRIIRPTKGVHLVVRRENVGNLGGLYLMSPVDGRGVFLLAHGDYTYLGTTDTDYNGDLDQCYTDRDEYQYLKKVIDHCFPDAKFEEEDLLGSYAGIRPLVLEEGVSETKTSRKELIDEIMPGFFVITGGKLTIFRSMAEKLIAFMGKRGALDVRRFGKRRSKSRLLMGMKAGKWKKSAPKVGLEDGIMEHIYQNYGRGGISILDLVKKDSSLGGIITDGQNNIWAELEYSLEYEHVTHVKDFLLRRTNLSLYQRDGHEDLGREVAKRMAKYLGWDEGRTKREISDYVDIAHKNSFFLKKKS